MADLPTIAGPYSNITSIPEEPPKGPKLAKVSRAILALQGLRDVFGQGA